MPEQMVEVSETLQEVTQEIAERNPAKVDFKIVDLSLPDPGISEQELFDRYQIQPVATSFFAVETFYLHLVIEAGADIQVIYPSGELSRAEIRNAIESSLKRSSSGFLESCRLMDAASCASVDQFGQQLPSLQQYGILEDTLRENYELRRVTLDEGQIAADIDVLILLAPHGLTDKQRYATDQYIMRGGSVIAAAGHYRLGIDPYAGTLLLDVNEGGIEEMLESYGIIVGDRPGDGLSECSLPAASTARGRRYGRDRDSSAGLSLFYRCPPEQDGFGQPGSQGLAAADDELGIAGDGRRDGAGGGAGYDIDKLKRQCLGNDGS